MAFSGKDGRRRWGPRRGKESRDRDAPLHGLGARGDGPRWPARGEGRPAVSLLRRGGAPVGMGLTGRACKLHGDEEKLAGWPIWAMWG